MAQTRREHGVNMMLVRVKDLEYTLRCGAVEMCQVNNTIKGVGNGPVLYPKVSYTCLWTGNEEVMIIH